MARYSVFVLVACACITAALLWAFGAGTGWGVCALLLLPLLLLGVWDISQRRSALRRNYPISAHMRYVLESFGPEIRQYFIERDTERVPFSREQRVLVYQRAKNMADVVPFGNKRTVYGDDYEWINHSMLPLEHGSEDLRIIIGHQASQQYSASVLNISAMSFGSLSANAVRALNAGAKRGGFFHDTGEGSISRYHREFGGDLVWEIGSGYFGCRDAQGRFSEEKFVENALDAQVKMIELKLSQGAKPGKGGVLPGSKVTEEIAAARGVAVGQDCISPARHQLFDTPIGLLQTIARMRMLSGGKPTGFKLAIGHPWEWFAVAKAMLETGIVPDFIVIDGAEGGTGAAPSEFIDHVGVPMREGLLLVHNTLVGIGLRNQIKLGAAGQIVSAFDMARTFAFGADWCNAARGFMFALGCIQSQSCHNDHCPTGIATQNPSRWTHLDVQDKAARVYQFHANTIKALADLLGAAGLQHPRQIGPEHILRRVSDTEVHSLRMLYPFLQPGQLLTGDVESMVFRKFWPQARADSFALH